VVTAGVGLLVNYWVAGQLLRKQEAQQSAALSPLEADFR